MSVTRCNPEVDFTNAKCGESLLHSDAMAGSPPKPYPVTMIRGQGLGFHCREGGLHVRGQSAEDAKREHSEAIGKSYADEIREQDET